MILGAPRLTFLPAILLEKTTCLNKKKAFAVFPSRNATQLNDPSSLKFSSFMADWSGSLQKTEIPFMCAFFFVWFRLGSIRV